MTRIIWLSRHDPLECQKEELKRLFGKIELLIDTLPFSGAKDILERYKLANADEIVVVAPLSVIERLCKLGIQPLYAEMKITRDDPDVESHGRKYKFVKFSRIKKVIIIKEVL